MNTSALPLLLAFVLLGRRATAARPPPPPPPPPPQGPPATTARKRLSVAELEQLALRAGWPAAEANRAARIAKRESGGDPRARAFVMQPKPGFAREDSRGLWQINVLAWPAFAAVDLYDPLINAKAALTVRRQQGWGAWALSSRAER